MFVCFIGVLQAKTEKVARNTHMGHGCVFCLGSLLALVLRETERALEEKLVLNCLANCGRHACALCLCSSVWSTEAGQSNNALFNACIYIYIYVYKTHVPFRVLESNPLEPCQRKLPFMVMSKDDI